MGSKTQKRCKIKVKLRWHNFGRENQLVQTQKKGELKKRAHDLKNQVGKAIGSNSRTQFSSNESKLVPRNLDPGPHLKWGLRLPFLVVPSHAPSVPSVWKSLPIVSWFHLECLLNTSCWYVVGLLCNGLQGREVVHLFASYTIKHQSIITHDT
jgi:hypothetical protein